MQINAHSILNSDAINLLIRGSSDYLILIRWDTGQGQECLPFQGHSLHVSDKSIEPAWDGTGKHATEPSLKRHSWCSLSVQQCCCSGKAVHGGENSMESWVLLLSIFLSKQSSGQRQMTFQYDIIYVSLMFYKVTVIHISNIRSFHSPLAGGYQLYNCITTKDYVEVTFVKVTLKGLT